MLFQLHRLRDTDLDGRIIVSGNQARVWKEAVTTYLLVLTLERVKKTPNNPRQ
jgi:hypothetical protein